jgi:hypothetical protein
MGTVFLCMGVAVAAAASIAVNGGAPFVFEGTPAAQGMTVSMDRKALDSDDWSLAAGRSSQVQAKSG